MGNLLVSCLTIFCCRIVDVSLGTIRTVFTVRGKARDAAIVGFFEVFIWYVVIQDALKAEGALLPLAVAYAGGYAMGTFVGGRISRKLISGNVTVQVVTSSQDPKILKTIRDAGYAITVLPVQASEYSGERYMIFAEVERKQLRDFREMVKSADEKMFLMSQETFSIYGGHIRRPGK